MNTAINKTSHKYIKKEPDGHGGWKYTYPDDNKYGGINHDITKTSGSSKVSKQGLAKTMNKNAQNGGGREAAQAAGSKINVDTAKRMLGGNSAGLYNPMNTRILSTQTNKAFKKARKLLNTRGGREEAQAKGAKINAENNSEHQRELRKHIAKWRRETQNGGGREAAQKKGSEINKKSKKGTLHHSMLRGVKKFRSM